MAFQLCLITFLVYPERALAVSPPTFSPVGGVYFPGPSVTLSAGSGATIFLTTDGTLPSTNSQVYSSAIQLNGTTTINAIAVQSGVSSTVATAVFTVDPYTWPLFTDTTRALQQPRTCGRS
jgi:chitinase